MTSQHTVVALDLASSEIFVRRPREAIRLIEREEGAATAVDAQLRGLAGQEAACRRVLGAVAAAFLRTAAHHALGFARLADYTRERLGLSAREVQSAAQVVSALATLPAIARAFDRGELSWTQVRLLTATATASTEAEWLRRARGRTVRALEALIRSAHGADAGDAGGASKASERAQVEAALAECAEEQSEDGEPVAVVRISSPARVRQAWRDTLELARRVAGEPLRVWQAAEAIAAEGLAGAPVAERARAVAEIEAGVVLAGRQDGASSGARSGSLGETSGMEVTRASADDSFETCDMFPPSSGEAERDRRAGAGTLPADVEALAGNLEDLTPAALDGRLRRAVRALQRLDWEAGRLLRLCFDLRLYRILGFSSAARYVRERLGLSTGKAAALVVVERRLRDVPALGNAYRDGRISWLQALTLLPVVNAHHAAAWIARAGEVTLRRLASEVRWALDKLDEISEIDERDGQSRRSAPSIAPPPPGATLERLPLQGSAPLQMRAHSGLERCDGWVTFHGPVSVVALFRAAIEAFRPPGAPAWAGLLALFDHVRAEWEAQPPHRDPIFARDGWQCTVPACSARRNLQDHHVRFRSRGGDNTHGNRTTVCAWHHLRAIHDGRVRVWGQAPNALHWELGVGTEVASGVDREVFLRLVGDRYVNRHVKGGASERVRKNTTRAA